MKKKSRSCPQCGKKLKRRKQVLKHGRTKHGWDEKK